ncbi:AAA family ATPase [Streptomyces caeruleatus]|uniref:ATP-binding protein n=1 Tax=Streptomyces caeruleatus TaxID=661399 RepID=A0A101U5W1_9ACTN|nr:AAA family ATPase [Streptomyces caeruleatus]KUO04797.1 hypothetical protein AQJ67_09820 [Streptomyces caeruleatus]
MIVAVGGRPWTGKTTLAKALAKAMSGVLLDKAALQKVLFPRPAPASPEQNDRLYEFLLQAAVWHLETTPGDVVVLDGRPLTRIREVLALRRFASGVDQPLRIIECVCPDEVAVDRARASPTSTEPLAVANEAPAEPIPDPKIVIDTSLPADQCLASALQHLSRAPTGCGTPQTVSPVQASRSGTRGTSEPLEQLAAKRSREVA